MAWKKEKSKKHREKYSKEPCSVAFDARPFFPLGRIPLGGQLPVIIGQGVTDTESMYEMSISFTSKKEGTLFTIYVLVKIRERKKLARIVVIFFIENLDRGTRLEPRSKLSSAKGL